MVTAEPHIERALAAPAELAHMTTGSYFAIVRAIRAMSAWTPPRPLPQIAVRSGQAIHVRVWRTSSAGILKASAAPTAPARPWAVVAMAAPATVSPAAARNPRRFRPRHAWRPAM